MKALLVKLADFYIYSSIHISIAVISLIVCAYFLFDQKPDYNLIIYCFFATMLMYTIHRLFALKRIPNTLIDKRFVRLKKFKSHIQVFGLIACIGLGYSFIYLTAPQRNALIFPIIISALYALPILPGHRRIRDFAYIKIFLIALIWAWVTVVIPLINLELIFLDKWLIFLERALFIFGITIPFDIRDLNVDKNLAVKTIPARIGLRKSLLLASAAILLAVVFAIFLYSRGIYTVAILLGSVISYGLIIFLINKSNEKRTDYFYSGWLDGTMILYVLILFLFSVMMD